MTDSELRLECLRMANAEGGSGRAIVWKAEIFYDFVAKGMVPECKAPAFDDANKQVANAR